MTRDYYPYYQFLHDLEEARATVFDERERDERIAAIYRRRATAMEGGVHRVEPISFSTAL